MLATAPAAPRARATPAARASQVGDDLRIQVNTLASGRFVRGFGPFSITLLNRKPPPGDTTMVKAMAGLLRSASTWRERHPGVKRVTFYAPTLVNPQLANQLRSLGFTEVNLLPGHRSQLVIRGRGHAPSERSGQGGEMPRAWLTRMRAFTALPAVCAETTSKPPSKSALICATEAVSELS